MGAQIHAARPGASIPAPGGPESVTFPASSSPTGLPRPHSRTEGSRKSDFVSAFLHTLDPLTSRASRGGHSLPGPPRDARDVEPRPQRSRTPTDAPAPPLPRNRLLAALEAVERHARQQRRLRREPFEADRLVAHHPGA